jgi:hypothetical protein
MSWDTPMSAKAGLEESLSINNHAGTGNLDRKNATLDLFPCMP